MRLSLLADNVSVHEIIFNGYVLENSKHESIRAWCACGELQLAAKIKQDRWKLKEGCLMAERTMEEFVRNVTTKSQSLLTRISQAANAIKMRIPHDRKFLPSKKEISLQQVWSYRVYRAYGPYRTSSRSTRSFRLQYTYIPSTTS